MSSANRNLVDILLFKTAGRWRLISEDISNLATKVRRAVGPTFITKLLSELDEAVEELHSAVSHFESSVKTPNVVIATTGTTSSGKSTLANVLIGEALLPKAVQEMSAGVVAVQHDDSIRRLIVENTKGATWETGTWDGLEASEALTRLESVMQTYLKLLRDDGERNRGNVEPPRFRILWPTRMGGNPVQFGLPEGVRLTIVDLPGLKYVDDDVNGSVVREQARKALSIVAYNSHETDSVKQESLLKQIVDEVKALSGSPARMLFVLNKIDAFRSDRDPQKSEREFTSSITKQIRDGIGIALPEYANAANAIQPIPFSSEPALYAILAEKAAEDRKVQLLRTLEKEYSVLFPNAEMDKLPRKPDDWNGDQRAWFINEARSQARLNGFERRLAEHIKQHLPEILLAELVNASYRSAQKALNKLDAFVKAYRLQEKEEAEKAMAQLESLYQRLQKLHKEALRPLNPFKELGNGDGELLEKLFVAVPKVEDALGLSGVRGAPGKLAALQSALPDAIQVPIQRLNDYVFSRMSNQQLEDDFIPSLKSVPRLHAALDGLRSSPYGKVWKQGGSFEGTEAEGVNLALDVFAKELSSMATDLVMRESSVQAERMKAALDVCAQVIINKLEADAAAAFESLGFQGLRGVFRGTFELAPPRLPRVEFAPDVKHWTRKEKETRKEVKWREKRIWWTLWIAKRWEKETRSVVVTVTKDGITVEKFGLLLEGFVSSAKLTHLDA